MIKKKTIKTTSSATTRSGSKLSKRNVILPTGALLTVLLVGWAFARQHQRADAIQTQQQRFNTIHSVESSFEKNIKNLLGPSLVNMHEESTCYNTDQGPWDNGELWCGVSVVGNTKELPSTVVGGQGAWNTITQIDRMAHNVVAKSGISYYSPGWDPGGPEPGDGLSYDDFFYLYGKKAQSNETEMRCDITANKATDTVIAQGSSGEPKQFIFKFSCDQRSYKTFFPYQAS